MSACLLSFSRDARIHELDQIQNTGTSAGSSSSNAVNPQSSYTYTPTEASDDHLQKLMSIFNENLTENQVLSVYEASGKSFIGCMECLSQGPTLNSLVTMLNDRMRNCERNKVDIDPDDIWQDLVVFYKSPSASDLSRQLRVKLGKNPAVDTGGVRREIYTTVFNQFLNNTHVRLFTGDPHSVRPIFTAESRASGLFKILGKMVGHSIAQDGIGFPFFSLPCYWYMAQGEEKATQVSSVKDVGADTNYVISKVTQLAKLSLACSHIITIHFICLYS